MSLKRIIILLIHEFKSSIKSFFFFQAILTPVLFSLVVSLVFGRLFLGTPDLGFLESERSEMVTLLQDDINISFYKTEADLLKAVEKGKVDMALKLPDDFDQSLKSNKDTPITIYFWGATSLLKRTGLTNSFSNAIRQISGRVFPVTLKPVYPDNKKSEPWFTRMMPLLVILAIMMSGMLLPSTSLVDEKQKETLDALLVTPVSYVEIQISKTFYGFILSSLMGLLILIINNALPEKWPIFLVTLLLAALCASTIGSLFGYSGKSILSVMNLIKSLMMVFYAPAILNFFLSIPDWVQKVFPTYYIYGPLIKISNNEFSLINDGWEILILFFIVLALQFWLYKIVNKERKKIICSN